LRNQKRWIFAGLLTVGLHHSVWTQGAKTQTPLLTTGVTGSIRASGLNNPQYVLSFIPVQRILLTAGQHPLTGEEVQSALKGTPVSLDDLLHLELLRKDGPVYRLNYLLLTVQDQETTYSTSEQFGRSLAGAFQAHKDEFDQIIARYPNASLRSQLLFDLVAGAALNWGGLDLTTELGYRIKPPRHQDGSVYFVHSAQVGAHTDLKGMYLDSEFAPAGPLMVATFGDGDSLPRLQGWPDVFDGLEHATDPWHEKPKVYGALQSEYMTYAFLALSDAGTVMDAISRGAYSDEALAKELTIPADRRNATIQLLLATGYLNDSDHRYSMAVPLLTASDKPMVDATLGLSRTIMTSWLQQNYPRMKDQLSGLSPMRSGVPFSLAFSEVWHYEFGFATRALAESGFYANPRAAGNRYQGYVPLVWTASVLKAPGN
jgi:hypothetical protein